MNTFLNSLFRQAVKCGLSPQLAGGGFSGSSITSVRTWMPDTPPNRAPAMLPPSPRVAVTYQA